MMKKIMMIAVLAAVALTVSAQKTLRSNGTFTLQPKVGIGIGILDGSWTSAPNVDNKTRVGFLAGVEGEYYVNNWLGVAAGLNYAQQGWKFKGGSVSETTKLDYLNIPITANFYVIDGLALKTGLQMGFLMSAKKEGNDIKDGCEKFNLSIPVGVSYEYANFVLDARYNISVTKVNKNSNADNKYRSSLLQFTIGYKFEL